MLGKTGLGGTRRQKIYSFPNVVFSESGGQFLPVLFEVLAGESTLVDDLHLLHYGTLPRLAGAYAVQNNLSVYWLCLRLRSTEQAVNQILCLRLRSTE